MSKIITSFKDILTKMSYILTVKQKKYCLVVFLMTLVGVLLETLGVSIILPLVQAMLYPEQILENKILGKIFFSLKIQDSFFMVLIIAAFVVMIYLLKNIYLVYLSYVRAKFSGNIQRSLGLYMMKSYLKRGYPFFLKESAHKLHRGITGDVSGVYNIIYNGFRMISECLTAFAIGVYILMSDFLMAIVILIIAGTTVMITMLISKSKMRSYGQKYRIYDTKMKACSYQTFHGIKEVLVMNKEEYFINEYKESCKEQQKALVGQTVFAEAPAFVFEAVCVIGMILAVCFRLALDGNSPEFVSNIAVFVVAAFRIMPSLGRIANAANIIMFNIPSMNAAYMNLLEANGYTYHLQIGEEVEEEVVFKEEVKLSDIYWKYEDATDPVIRNLNLSIKKGSSIALIGESGAGKSTLADMVLGLLKPFKGVIEIDGIDINTIPRQWHKIIGYVPQSVYILDDTIRKNVAYGILEEDIDDSLVWKVLEQAQLSDFVKRLPEQLDTILGERGIRFSGGQRQRIAIARCLYHEPEILVLDEATSALDNKTEEAIMEAIELLRGYKTLIIVAHRLTTIKECDYIYEIKDGKAIERNKEEIFLE
ncbi:MAG: ABC transporter ATP-binding protein [Lachnospiraceae bacterium]|nr:ABC transporter ATP-binding protein [Lachnospiraceae bacterium]